jgi:hypothetical protein
LPILGAHAPIARRSLAELVVFLLAPDPAELLEVMPVRRLRNPFDSQGLLENGLDRGIDAGSLLFGTLFQENPDRIL